jgi:hypothetical protein
MLLLPVARGQSLGEMTQAGIPVPPGFVVLASAFEDFCAQADLTQEIDAILGDVDTKAVHTVEKASARIQALILEAAMPDDIAREILTGFRGLSSTYVAVRSSATAEDSADHAWAGQLDTFLNTTEETLLRNVQKCWASLYTPRAIFYRFEKGLHISHISVAVVVQTMVNSEKSGIAFSVHPVTEDPDQLIIEAGFGLGEAIVSGQVTPDSYVVSKSEHACIDININDQGRGLFRNPKGGNEWKELGEQGTQQVLSESEILELSTLIKKIEDHYDSPQDIEWAAATEDGKLKFYITQSRPITTLSTQSVNNRHEDVTQEKPLQVIIDEFNATPFVVHSLNYVMENDVKAYVSKPPRTFFIFKDGNMQWGADVANCETVANEIVKKLIESPNSYHSFNQELFADITALKSEARRMYDAKKSTYSRDDLYKAYTQIMNTYARVYARGMVPSLADLVEPRLSITVKELLAPYTNDVDETFVTLTTPVELSTVAREERDIIRLALNMHITEDSTELATHADTYYAIFFGYEGPFYTKKHVWERIKELRQDTGRAQNRLEELNAHAEKTTKQINAVEKELGLPKDIIDVLHITRGWLFSKEARKDAFFCAYAAMDLLAEAIAQETKVPKQHLKFLVRPEAEALLAKGAMPDDLEERRRLMVVTSQGGKVLVLSGDTASSYITQNVATPYIEKSDVIEGQIAYKGKLTVEQFNN